MSVSSSQMDASTHAKTSNILNGALYSVENVKVHQDLCREVVSFALQNTCVLSDDEDWSCIVQELDNAIQEWARLSPVESFLKCDIIAGKIASLRTAISNFCGIPQTVDSIRSDALSDASSLIPTILSIFSAPDAFDDFDALPSAHKDTAVSLLRRVLVSTLPPDNTPLNELISGCIGRLESREVYINFDLPDLSSEIRLVQSQPVSSGHFGDVYLANHCDGKLVTVRVLKTISPADTRTYKALGAELKLRTTLRHPNLLPSYGICSTNLGTCIVSPYIANGSAKIYLACYPEANAISLLTGAANGLNYLHTCWPSISHGDVRGENILISSTGEALLADHALGKIMEEKRTTQLTSSLLGSLNAAINVAGIRWAAPEIVCREEDIRKNAPPSLTAGKCANSLRGGSNGFVAGEDAMIEVVTSMSDVWSFGMTIYELLTGRNPFYQHTRLEMVVLAISLSEHPLAPTSPEEVRAEWQPELWSLMQECWWMDRRQRPTMDTIAKRMSIIHGKSLIMHSSHRRARNTTSPDGYPSLTLTRTYSHSGLRSIPPSPFPSLLTPQIARSTSNPSLSSWRSPTISTTPHSKVNPSSPVSFSRSLSGQKPLNFSMFSLHKNLVPPGRPQSRSSVKGRENEGRRENLHAVGAPPSWKPIELGKMSVTKRRSLIYGGQTDGSTSQSSRVHGLMQSLPSSPPRSLSPGSSRNGHGEMISENVTNVIIPVQASPLTMVATSTSSKMTLSQLPKIVIPSTNGFTRPHIRSAGTTQSTSLTSTGSEGAIGDTVFYSRTSAPLSVYSSSGHASCVSPGGQLIYGPGEESFEIVKHDRNDSTLDVRMTKRRDPVPSLSSEFSEPPISLLRHSRRTSEWVGEALSRVSFISGTRSYWHVPEDVLSNSTDSQLGDPAPQFSSGLDIVINGPDSLPISGELQTSLSLIEQMQRDEADFISTSLGPGVLQWVGQPKDALIPLIMAQQAEKGIRDAYSSVITAHHNLQGSLVFPMDLRDFKQFLEGHNIGLPMLQTAYQDYVEALSNLNDILTNALDGDFGKMHRTNAAKYSFLSSNLRRPFSHLISYASSLRLAVESLSRFIPHEDATSWKQVADDWINSSHQIQLLSWQASLGRDSLVLFDSSELYPCNESDRIGSSRHGIQLRIIERQSKFVGEAKSAGKILETILRHSSLQAESREISDKLSDIYRSHMTLLDDLYGYQREQYPSIPTILPILLDAATQWEGLYTAYSSLLTPIISTASTFERQGDVEATGADIMRFLTSPLRHIRVISRLAKALLDIAGDQPVDLEPIKRLINTFDTLLQASHKAMECSSIDEDIDSLMDLLSWDNGTAPNRIALEHESRHIKHMGVLHYPLDPSGTRVSIDDRGSSVEVFLVLFDNCLLVTEPHVRHGIERLGVKVALHLDDVFLPDSEVTRASQQQIFLLDSEKGKKIASPVLLRYRDTSTPRTIAPRPRAASTASALGIREEDGMHILYPKELLLLANSPSEVGEWRTHLSNAKLKLEESGLKLSPPKSMFKVVPIATLQFAPNSTTEFFSDGERIFLFCAESGVFIKKRDADLMPFPTPAQAKQCCVVNEMRTALVLVGKSLWALKLDDLLQSETLHPVVVKNNASLFRVGYQRGQLLLVVACEAAKYTTVKWYTISSRMCRPSLLLSSGIFGRSKKPFRFLGEQEIPGAIHGLDILECGIVAMGVSGFQLLVTDQGQTGKSHELPRIRAGASSEAAQRCRTSKAVGAIRCDDHILLCYSDFGVYVSTSGDIIGRAIDWTSSRISAIFFAVPYFFLIAENHIEVRLVENGRKLETVQGEGFRPLNGIHGTRTSTSTLPGGIDGDSYVEKAKDSLEDHPGLLHLITRRKDSDSEFDFVELQMEVLDLAP